MIKISSKIFNSINFGTQMPNSSYATNPKTAKQTNELQNIKPSYQIKTPMQYAKLTTLNLPNNLQAECYKLANGQKIVIIPKSGETTINTYVNTGSMNEPDNLRGISHYIEHNLFNGSEGLNAGDFFKRVNEMGANTNASTSYASTNYFIKSNLLKDTDFEEMVKLHASMLETPRFAQEMLDKEKPIVSSEINMITQDPDNITTNLAIKNLYGIKTTSNDMIGGTCENIKNLTREDIVKYYNDNYYPANMTTVITGDISPQTAMSTISKYFSSVKTPSKPQSHETLTPIQNIKREDKISDKATSSYMTIAINGAKNSDLKEKLALNCVMESLFSDVSSRVNSKLKDLGIAVSESEEKISSNPNDNSVCLLNVNSTDDNVEKALKQTFDEIAKLKTQPISQDELNIIKKNMIKSYLMNFDDNFDINGIIGSAFLNNNTDLIENYEKTLNSITTDDIQKAVTKYLDTNKMSIAVTHPSSSTPDTIKTSYKKANTAVSFTGNSTKKAIDTTKINASVLPNKIRLITNDSNSKIGHLNYNLKSNNLNDDYSVETEVLSSMMQKGTMNSDEISFNKSLKDNAMMLYGNCNNNEINISGNFYTEDSSKIFNKMKELLYSPRLTQENFDIVKQNIKEELLTKDKSAYDKLENELFPKNFNGMKKEEITKKLDTLTLNDIKAFYTKLIAEGQGTMTVTGPVKSNPEFNQNILRNTLSLPQVRDFKYDMPQIFKPQTNTKILTDSDNKPQAQIIEAYTFKNSENIKDNTTINLLNTILGGTPSSRLFLDLREKQKLAYRVESQIETQNDLKMMTLSIGTTTDDKTSGIKNYDNIKKSITGFNNNIKRIMTEKVTTEELENAKLSLKNKILSNLQTSSSENSYLASFSRNPYGITYLNQVLEIIDTITLEDINNCANYIFKNKPIYSILATKDTLDANKDYLKSLDDNN